MHRFIQAFRKYGLDRRYGAVLVVYADDFVVLCQRNAGEALEEIRRILHKIGLTINETKTSVRFVSIRNRSIVTRSDEKRWQTDLAFVTSTVTWLSTNGTSNDRLQIERDSFSG